MNCEEVRCDPCRGFYEDKACVTLRNRPFTPVMTLGRQKKKKKKKGR